jgi:hypothetical protein
MNKKCRHCKEPLPPYALHFSNETAIEIGYCCYFCMSSALGEEKALKALQKYQEKAPESLQERRSQGDLKNRVNEQDQNTGNSRGKGKKSVLELILDDDAEEVGDRA